MPRDEAYDKLEHKLMALRQTSRTGDERQTMSEVFDKGTILSIYKLMKDGIIDTLEHPISTGKEGNVFAARDPQGKMIALKIYRVSNATFNRISRYIEGDKRFRGLSGSRRKIIMAWASKEFRNLQRMYDAGINVPKPLRFHRNMVVMEYIGTEDSAAPLIKDVVLEDPDRIYEDLLRQMKLMYKEAGLVHADLSEYNILYSQQNAVIIDVGQAVLIEHLNTKDFLYRDIDNINRFFRSRGVEVKNRDDIFKNITEMEE
ncbi:MAG: serine protein kinase RIO [Euryarchaeota archaeon]|nr:serine protein kinase RIO [Euryarchaeota archaeon]